MKPSSPRVQRAEVEDGEVARLGEHQRHDHEGGAGGAEREEADDAGERAAGGEPGGQRRRRRASPACATRRPVA